MSITTKWILAVITAAVIGGGTVALLGNNASKPTPTPQPTTVQQPTTTTQPSPTQTTKKDGCLIKGNISSSGEKIYHMPGQRYYDKTKIDESAGERWFCTEDEAVSAGWRKSKV